MYVYVWSEKKGDEKQGAVLTKKIQNNIFIYIYIYIYREGNKKRERRGEEEAPSPETAGESKELELALELFHGFTKKSPRAHLLDRLPLPHLRQHLVEID